MEELRHLGCGGAESVLNLEAKSSVAVAYHPDFGSHGDLLLLELDHNLLQDVLHQRVTLRGQPDDDAVLCTPSKTYGLKFVGTSNSVLLIPPMAELSCRGNSEHGVVEFKDGEILAPVIKVAPGVMELNEVAPRLDKLKLLLSEMPYSSEEMFGMEDLENREERKKKMYRWDDLVERVQASDDDLRAGLEGLSAVEIDGYWRVVDEKCMDKVLGMLLYNSVLNDWSLNALNEDEVASALASDEFPVKLVLHCLRVYGSKIAGGESTRSTWGLDERRVCVHFAREILRAGKRKLENFMQEWLQKVPDGMQASFDMLEGEVLTEKLGVETWVRAFSVSSLPSNPAMRFSMLFRERSKWEWKDLQPYIRDLSVPGLSPEGLLLKYTRRIQSTPDAEPVFSAR